LKDFIIISVIALVILVGLVVGGSVFISNDNSELNLLEDVEKPATRETSSGARSKLSSSKSPILNKSSKSNKKKSQMATKKANQAAKQYAISLANKNKAKLQNDKLNRLKLTPEHLLIETSDIKGEHTIAGHVLNLKTNNPLSLVKVSLYTEVGQFIQRVRTNNSGRFELKNVPIKGVHLMISKKDFVKLKIKHYNAEKFKLHLLEKLDPGIFVKGTVISKKSEIKLINANIQVYKGRSIVKTGIKTDQQGNFEIKGLPKGKLELIFSKSGYSSGAIHLELNQEDVLDLTARLEQSSTLEIEVLTDVEYKEIPSISVYYDNSFKAKQYERSVLSQHNNKNIYLIHGIEGNFNLIRIHATGFIFPDPKSLKLIPGEKGKIIFNLTSGWKINCVVLDDKGKVLPDVNVKVFEFMGIGRSRRENILKGTFVSDENGAFEVSGISKGQVELVVESTVYKRVNKKVLIDSISMPPIELILTADSFFDGSVKNSKGEAIDVHQVRFTPVNANGKFDPTRNRPRFEGSLKLGHFKMSGVVEGSYKVSITARKYKALILSNYLIKPDQKTDEFILKDGLTVTGIIRNKKGVGLVDTSVWFTRKEKKDKFQHKTKTDSNGFYLLESLESGKKYNVFAQASGYVMTETSLEVTPETNELDLILEKKKFFTGIVYDASTKSPIQHFQIKLLGPFGRGLIQDSSQKFNVANGQFSMPVSAESFTVILTSTGYADIVLKNRTLNNLNDEYFLMRGGSIYFTVKLKDTLASMKRIVLSKMKDVDSDKDRKTVLTNQQGIANFKGLMPGHYYYRIRNIKGYANYNGELIVTPNEPLNEVVQMIKGFILKGRLIYSDDNRPVKSGEVYLDFDIYNNRPMKKYINQDGFFEFPNVIPGDHIVKIKYGTLVNKLYAKEKSINVTVPNTVSRDGVFMMDTIEVD